jgi:hypothetical protein
MDFRRALRLTATALLLGAVPAVVPLHSAFAQFSMGNSGGGGTGGAMPDEREQADQAAQAQAKADAKAAAPPAAIPGAVTDEATATSGHISADMEPTAALFDAINRGDITSAKEALGRGADLNGKNVLGQSPLDMAIDLNRNDLTFLLLSMRNSEQGTRLASVDDGDSSGAVKASVKAGHAKIGRATRLVADKKPAGRARQYASDGGAPKPDVGFLGFGGS